jgi:hypothetical protein
MKTWIASNDIDRTFQGLEFPANIYVEVFDYLRAQLLLDEVFLTAIDSGFVTISYNGVNAISSATKAKAYLRANVGFQSSFAVDKNNIDQVITVDSAEKLAAERVLWDTIGDYDLGQSKFIPPIDGVWNCNGTIAVKDCLNVARVAVQIWRDDELWFTVSQKVPNAGTTFLPFGCDVDAYNSEGHNFDLRVALDKTVAEDPISATVSGSDEETAWGMTFLTQLVTPSPT